LPAGGKKKIQSARGGKPVTRKDDAQSLKLSVLLWIPLKLDKRKRKRRSSDPFGKLKAQTEQQRKFKAFKVLTAGEGAKAQFAKRSLGGKKDAGRGNRSITKRFKDSGRQSF